MIHNDRIRPLTKDEVLLATWMLENGDAEVREYLVQLDQAETMVWREMLQRHYLNLAN